MKTSRPILCKIYFTCSILKHTAITPCRLFLIGMIFFYQIAQCQSPGGVSSGLYLWLKADAGVVQSSGNVSQWNNQAATSMTTQVSKTISSAVTLVSNGINNRPVIRFNGTESIKGTYASVPNQPALIFAVAIGRTGSGEQRLGNIYANSPAGAMGMNYDATAGSYSVDLNGGSCSVSGSLYNQPSLLRVYYRISSGGSPSTASGCYTALNGIQYTACGNDGKLTIPSGGVEIGGRTWDVNGRFFVGDIAEVIYYNANTATATQVSQIESYLAFKYGLSLGNTSNLRNYIASDGTTNFWTGNSIYQNNIFGIGTDNGSALVITQSNSMNTGTGNGSGQSAKGNILLSVSSALSDKQFLMVGDDAGSLNEQTTNLPSIYAGSSRVGRTWKVKNTGSVSGSVNLSFDMTGITFGGGNDPAKYRLMVNTNGSSDFTTGTPAYYVPSSISGNKINFTGVTLSDNSVFSFITNSSVPLPLTWINFTSGFQNGNISLKWKTADEFNVEKYEIEHSLSGSQYILIASVQAKGNSQINEYEYTYNEPANGIHYYRLKEIDKDGSYKYSAIRTAVTNNRYAFQIQSNPVSQSLLIIINSASNGKAKLQVTNMEGKVLIKQDEQLSEGRNQIKLNIDFLPEGIYFLQTEIGKTAFNIKFLNVKQ
jgi:hypothetical protein